MQHNYARTVTDGRFIRATASEPSSSGRAPPNFGGGGDQANDNDGRDYKLIIDPALGQGKDKVIRYNGCMPGRDLVPVGLVDPRPRISRYSLSRHSVNLRIPDFQVDQNYVGKILPKEVTLTNLNNNINVSFLQDMCKAFGDIRKSIIFYHPKTKKHLGIAQVVFSSARAAQRCIEKLNETSKMGNIISVFADPSGGLRKKLLDELMTDKVVFRPPSPKLQLPANIMEEMKNAAATVPPPPSSSSSATIRHNGIGQLTSKTSSPSTNTTAPRSTTLRTNVYSDPDLRRSHSNGASFPSSQRGDNAFPERAEPTIRRQSSSSVCVQSQTTDPSSSAFYHHLQQQQQLTNQSAWNQSHHDQSQPPPLDSRSLSVFNQSAFPSGPHQSNSFSETVMDRPNWRERTSERYQMTPGYIVPQTTNSLDGFGPQKTGDNECDGQFSEAYRPMTNRRTMAAVDLAVENSNESFHLGRQSNNGFHISHADAFRRAASPGNFASQNSEERPFGPPAESSQVVSFGPQSSRSLESQQTPSSSSSQSLSQVGFSSEAGFSQTNSPAVNAQHNSLSHFRQNSLSGGGAGHERLSSEGLQKSSFVVDQSAHVEITGDPRRRLKGDSKGQRQKHEDQTKRQQSRDKVDFRKSISHDVDHGSKHSSRRRDGSRHRNHGSSHGRRRSRHKKHRYHHRSSSSRGSSSRLSHDSSSHQGLSRTADDLPPPQGVLPALPPSDCLPPSSDVLSSVSELSLPPHPSLESRIQQLLGQADHERNAINGFSRPIFPPPLPPEQPPPPPPPAETELPPLPPEPAPADEVVDVAIVPMGVQHLGQNILKIPNYSDNRNYTIYNSSANCKADESVVESGQQMMSSSVETVASDCFRPELQYPPYWYAPYPVAAEVSNSLPVDNGLYGNRPIDNGLYGNLPFDNALYSMAAYSAAFGLPPGGLSREDVVDDRNFSMILEELVAQLKKVMVKDMQKKMVENIGFKVYENWWKKEEDKEKVTFPKPLLESSVKSKLELRPSSSSLGQTVTPAPFAPALTSDPVVPTTPSVVSSVAPTKPACDSSGLLSSLFDNNKDGGGGRVGFGGGGLLGLRGAVAKMPSFRKKLPSPLPEKEREDDDEEEDEDEDDEEEEELISFRGPRTPEESENEEEDEVAEDEEDASSSSLEDEEDLAMSMKLLQRKHRPSRAFVYSSSSSSSSGSGDEEEMDAVRPEGVEEEDEQVSQGEEMTAESDLDGGQQSEAPELESDEGPKRQRRLLLSSDDEDEAVVIATKPEKEKTPGEDRLSLPPNAAKDPPPSLPSLSPAAAAAVSSSSLASALMVDDKQTPVITASPTVPSLPPLKPDSLSPESLIQDHPGREDETEADEKSDSLRHEDSTEALKSDRLEEKNKELSLLPKMEALHLVEEWLSAMTLDHAYSLSPTLFSTKKGRKPRVQRSICDEDLDVDLSDDTLSLSDSAIGLTATLPSPIAHDHNYCHPFFPVDEPRVLSDSDSGEADELLPVRIITDSGDVLNTEDVPNILMEVDVVEEEAPPVEEEDEIPVTRKRKRLSDVTNFPGSRELANILPPVVRKPEFGPRGEKEETELLEEYLEKGLDAEDMAFLKRQYDELVQEDCSRTYWVNETHWVSHPPTFELPPPRKRSRTSRHHADTIDHQHATGSARTEGYYKISRQAKSLYLRHTRGVDDNDDDDQKRCVTDEVIAKKKSQQSRDVRSESRRWQNLFTTDLGDEIGDILKFNKLEIRKKQLKFARSRIHDWGLFAKEPIGEGEMVIEYVGEVVRRSVADTLEKRYEALGIGSSYLFRVDHNVIIDATKHGNLSRFINHSCSPNCYAKIITVDSAKKIVIYSKRDIQINDEITYDYKFPLEDEKIPCLCGASGCRGTLN